MSFSFSLMSMTSVPLLATLSSCEQLHNCYDCCLSESMVSIKMDSVVDFFVARASRVNFRNPRIFKEFFTNKDYILYSSSYRLRHLQNCLDINVKSLISTSKFKNALFNFICYYIKIISSNSTICFFYVLSYFDFVITVKKKKKIIQPVDANKMEQ